MTEKRFTLKHINEQHISANLYDKGTFIGSIGMGEELITELLNQLNDKNIELHIQNDFLKDENTHMRDLVNENKQLKQRNTNQYNQLNELWEIIEEESWEKLIAMNKQLKEDEERLQQEWKCYE